MAGTERINESVPGLRSWASSAMGTLQFGHEGGNCSLRITDR